MTFEEKIQSALAGNIEALEHLTSEERLSIVAKGLTKLILEHKMLEDKVEQLEEGQQKLLNLIADS